jgi:hypothetical protein
MKKETKISKLRLNRETLRNLSLPELEMARGGATTTTATSTSDACTSAYTCYCGTTGSIWCDPTGGSARC